MEPPDTLTVRATAVEEVQADHADLTVTIKGSTLFTGSAALQKAREIRQLVADLAAVGIPETAITLLSVSAETSSNMIGSTSSARYQLRVRCAQLDTLADVLGAVTGQKNAQLNTLIWRYPDAAPTHDLLLQRGLARAQAKAEIMAHSLASKLGRVHSVSETLHDSEATPPMVLAPAPMAAADARARRMTTDDFGLTLTHSKRLTVEVAVVFHIVPE